MLDHAAFIGCGGDWRCPDVGHRRPPWPGRQACHSRGNDPNHGAADQGPRHVPIAGGLERPELWVVKVATRIAVSSWRRRRRETQLGRELEAEVADSIARIWTRRGLEGLSPQQRLTAYPQEYVTRTAFCAAANLNLK